MQHATSVWCASHLNIYFRISPKPAHMECDYVGCGIVSGLSAEHDAR